MAWAIEALDTGGKVFDSLLYGCRSVRCDRDERRRRGLTPLINALGWDCGATEEACPRKA